MKKSEHSLEKEIVGGLALAVYYRQLKPEEFAQAFKIRVKVFVEEQKVPIEEEHDCYDKVAQHFGVFQGNELIGTGRLVLQPKGGKIGRVAILPEHRGKGLGRGLIEEIIKTGRAQGIQEFELGAQLQAMAFYQQLGFNAKGDIFLDGGIPHRTMSLSFVKNED